MRGGFIFRRRVKAVWTLRKRVKNCYGYDFGTCL